MLNRIKMLFDDSGKAAAEPLSRDDKLQLAAAALLVEAAHMDGAFDGDERLRVGALLKRVASRRASGQPSHVLRPALLERVASRRASR